MRPHFLQSIPEDWQKLALDGRITPEMVEASIMPARSVRLAIRLAEDSPPVRFTINPGYDPNRISGLDAREVRSLSRKLASRWIEEQKNNPESAVGAALANEAGAYDRVRKNRIDVTSAMKEDGEIDSAIEKKLAEIPLLPTPILDYVRSRFSRTIRGHHRQQIEMIGLHAGLVGKRAGKKISDLNHGAAQHAKWSSRIWASGVEVRLPRGESIPMIDLLENKKKARFAELVAISNGLEKHARSKGLSPGFLTLTAPAQFHPNPSIGKNSWNGSTPREAANWLQTEGERLRSRLAKSGITMSGIRVFEMHDDECPHLHALIYAAPDERAAIDDAVRFVPDWKSEAGAQIRWLDDLDETATGKKKASASTYILKYVLKALIVSDDDDGENYPNDEMDRNTEALKLWGIRSISLIGLPNMQIWRTLRDTRTVDLGDCDYRIAGLRFAARNGDYRTFLEGMGGMGLRQSERGFRYKEIKKQGGKKGGIIVRVNDEKPMTILLKDIAEIREVTLIPNCPRKTKTPDPETLYDWVFTCDEHGNDVVIRVKSPPIGKPHQCRSPEPPATTPKKRKSLAEIRAEFMAPSRQLRNFIKATGAAPSV